MKPREYLSVRSPWLMFFTIGRPCAGIVCLFLQASIIGIPFATSWAINAIEEYEAGEKRKQSAKDSFAGLPKSQSSETSNPKGTDNVINSNPVKRSLAGKIALVLLVALIVFSLAMAVTTYHETRTGTMEKIAMNGETENNELKGCPPPPWDKEEYINELIQPQRDACVFYHATPDSKTDGWIIELRAKKRGANINVVDVIRNHFELGKSILISIPFKQIYKSDTTAKYLIPSQNLQHSGTDAPWLRPGTLIGQILYVQIGSKTPVKSVGNDLFSNGHSINTVDIDALRYHWSARFSRYVHEALHIPIQH